MYTDWHEVEFSVCISHVPFALAINLLAPSLFMFLNLQSNSAGSNQSTDTPVQLHESTGSGHLAVCAGSLCFSLHDNVYRGAILTIWMAQSTSLWCGESSGGESVLTGQQLLVHHWHSYATGIWPQPKGSTGNPLALCKACEINWWLWSWENAWSNVKSCGKSDS